MSKEEIKNQNILPNLSKSTENLSKIEDKDEWLKGVRGEDELIEKYMREIEKLYPLPSNFNKTFTTYDKVKAEWEAYKLGYAGANNKLEELEKWIESDFFKIMDKYYQRSKHIPQISDCADEFILKIKSLS